MANQDTTVEVESGEDIGKGVETTKVADETEQDNTQEDQTDTGDEQGGEETEDGGDTETKVETKAEFKKRFTQLKGEDIDEYLKNLEDAYANSSTEGQRLNQRATEAERKFNQVATLVATDPDFATKLADATGEDAPAPIVDPAVQWAKQKMEEDYAKDYTAFADLHPEVVSDPDLYNEVVAELDIIAAAHEARGAKLSMAEGLRKAWISLGKDDLEKKEDVMDKTKEQASVTTPQGTAKKTGEKTSGFTPEQIAVAEKMGLTVKQLTEARELAELNK
jgi:hypothetical protein